METANALVPKRQASIDVWPHPITAAGRHTLVVDEGETLHDVFHSEIPRHVHALAQVNGVRVERRDWHTVHVRHEDVIKVRRLPEGGDGSNPLAVVFSIAVLIAAPFLATAIAPSVAAALGITSAAGLAGVTYGLTALIGTVGLLIVNAIFPPRLPNQRGLEQAPRQYSLAAGQNRIRPFEPLIWVLGTHRVFPDLAALEYTEFDQNGDQYLNAIYDFGIGTGITFTPFLIGKTRLDSYESVTTQTGVSHVTLVKGNVDTIAGGDIGYQEGQTHIVTRMTADDTTRIAFDIVAVHFNVTSGGDVEGRNTHVLLEYRRDATGPWTTHLVTLRPPDGPEGRNAVRRSFAYEVTAGAYEVRAREGASGSGYAADADLTRITVRLEIPQFRAFQDEVADFTGRNPLAVRIKATGQLYGRVDQISSVLTNGSSNPADVYLAYLRGYRIRGLLKAGVGLPDRKINFDLINAWRTFCTDNELTCNIVFEDGRDHAAALELIAQCGWASPDDSTGKKGVIWEDDGRLMTAMITPDNILADSLSISYQHDGLADEVVGTFLDAENDWLPTTIRRPMPFVDSPERPVDVELEGITDGDQAAKELNRTVAAQHYHTRLITFEMDLDEGMGIMRGDVIGAGHGLLGHGSGGRFVTISGDRRDVGVSIDPEHEDAPMESGWIWVWDLAGNILTRQFTRTAEFELRLDSALPGVGDGNIDDPSAYRFMAFSAEADVIKLRITGREINGTRVRFTARDEIQAYYDYRTSDLTWTPVDARGDRRAARVEGFSVSETPLGERLFTWSEYPGATGYEIRYGGLATAWDAMTRLHTGLLTASPFGTFDRPPEGTFRCGIIAVRDDGSRTEPDFVMFAFSAVVEGLDGTDGNGIEYIFAATTTANAPALPSNDWGFDTPGTAAGADRETPSDIWKDGLAGTGFGEVRQYLWRATRQVPGTPARGANVAEAWRDTYRRSGRHDETPPTGAWGQSHIALRWGQDGPPGADALPSREFIFTVSATPTLAANRRPSNDWGFDRPGTVNGQVWTDGAQSVTQATKYLLQASREVPAGTAVGGAVADAWTVPAVVGAFGVDGLAGEDGNGIEFIFAVTTGATPSSPSNAWTFDRPVSPWFDAAPNVPIGSFLWIATRRIDGFPVPGDAVSGSWTSPRQISRAAEDGEDGEKGDKGDKGDPGEDAVAADTSKYYDQVRQTGGEARPSDTRFASWRSGGPYVRDIRGVEEAMSDGTRLWIQWKYGGLYVRDTASEETRNWTGDWPS